jgi:hypothetical protein
MRSQDRPNEQRKWGKETGQLMLLEGDDAVADDENDGCGVDGCCCAGDEYGDDGFDDEGEKREKTELVMPRLTFEFPKMTLRSHQPKSHCLRLRVMMWTLG